MAKAKGKAGGGFRLFGFRQGDRSEYLAAYALSRIAFITPVLRATADAARTATRDSSPRSA